MECYGCELRFTDCDIQSMTEQERRQGCKSWTAETVGEDADREMIGDEADYFDGDVGDK